MPKTIDESSPSVQTHLGIVQGVISRMASNSASCKTWCITIVSAILVIVGEKNNSKLALIAIFPTVLFLALDAYYLALEKGFRASYTQIVDKLHDMKLNAKDLYEVAPLGNIIKLTFRSILSFSIWPFYLMLGVMIYIGMKIIS